MTTGPAHIRQRIENLYETDPQALSGSDAPSVFAEFRSLLGSGRIRAAEKANGSWRVNDWVKKGILLGFRLGVLREVAATKPFLFFDKNTLPLKDLSEADEIRLVPGGSAIRDGAFVAKGVICMPPMYINIGAYVEEGTLIDSHALVGSCAQIGKRVHLSAGAQVGGVLEPVGALPVIIEDDVFVGGNCGVYEGAVVCAGAVLAAGVILTRGTAVYDIVRRTTYRAEGESPLAIPGNAVVVPGARALQGEWASAQGISVATPVVVKYRDRRTDLATVLEEALR